ncbi:hypothetical protein KEM54_000397 [Ascosphaera aggregata]|nr:hypothetical protein KEM54_000397 [Ascosphaera aggregata]
MPAYFYHIAIDLLKDSSSSELSGVQPSLLAESYRDAFRVFQRPQAIKAVTSSRKSVQSQSSLSRPSSAGSSEFSGVGLVRDLNDLRVGSISLQCIDMVSKQDAGKHSFGENQISTGIGTGLLGGLATRGKFIPLNYRLSDYEYGCVHLYRDAKATPSLSANDDDPSFLKGSSLSRRDDDCLAGPAGGSTDSDHGDNSLSVSPEDCKVLCILAVPAYLSPSDFLGFVGPKTREQVSHFRMVRTSRANRYMVLMKFRNAQQARQWQSEWNGKVFNSMEPETCHVVFVKSIEVRMDDGEKSHEAEGSKDTQLAESNTGKQNARSSSFSVRPLAPPTPALIELPTCPVCLERMDETNGLLTIICQHVFHCTCLEKWKGSGCPVCRYTQNPYARRSQGDPDDETAFCKVCHTDVNLWVCLICGNVGCGRYDEAHAIAHFGETGHAFAMDLSTQRVWDYVGDGYVHRIIQNQADGKLVELPAADDSALEPPDWSDAVPREKLENISVEYTHLLTSQLESQRAYFEEKVERAADKASEASAAAEAAQSATQRVTTELAALMAKYENLMRETIPALERDKIRAERRCEKFESLARNMENQWQEEKTINSSLMERINHMTNELLSLKAENADLKEQNRDLTFFISGSERLKNQGHDVVEGSVSIADPPKPGKRSNRRRRNQT